MSWVARLRALLSDPCERCGAPTVIEREQLVARVPFVFEVVAVCPRCARTVSRPQVIDCLQ